MLMWFYHPVNRWPQLSILSLSHAVLHIHIQIFLPSSSHQPEHRNFTVSSNRREKVVARGCAYSDRGGVQAKATHSNNSMNRCLIFRVIVSVGSSPIFYRHCFALLGVNSTRPLIVMNMSPQSEINLYFMLSYSVILYYPMPLYGLGLEYVLTLLSNNSGSTSFTKFLSTLLTNSPV